MSGLIRKSKIKRSAVVLIMALLLLAVGSSIARAETAEQEIDVSLEINASWSGGEMLSLDITDLATGERQQVAIRLSDFISDGENAEHILLQAMDLLGERQSGVIQIDNPLFEPANSEQVSNSTLESTQNQSTPAEPATPTLTPDGTGSVVDNIMTVNDIEFFTVQTDNGSDFFLVIDRQRASNNVYLLNTVTEADLVALAEARGETLEIPKEFPEVPTPDEIEQNISESVEQSQFESPETSAPQGNSNSGVILLVIIMLILIGGGIAVWKVLLPKLKSMTKNTDEEIEDDEDYENDGELEGGSDDENFEAVEVDDDGEDE